MDWLFSDSQSRYYRPKTVQELVQFISKKKGPFSIAGQQYSSGGQTLTQNGSIISLQHLPDTFQMSPCHTQYWVSAGQTWYQVLKHLLPFQKVPLAMQSYYSFSVGGSISVNAHGRNGKRLSDSCLKMEVLLMNGEIIKCSPQKYSDLYFSVLGGYGCIGIILRAKLKCVDNIPIVCRVFKTSQKNSSLLKILKTQPLLYNTELNSEGKLIHICWYPATEISCDCELSEQKELSESATPVHHALARFGQTLLELFPLNIPIYQNYRWNNNDGKTCYLSYEMAEDASKLVPLTGSTLIKSLLQEYFIPFEKLFEFCDFLLTQFDAYSSVQLINLSIRTCQSTTNGGYLDWLENIPSQRMAVVVYCSVIETFISDIWQDYHELTHSLIQKSWQMGGTWYLPYVPEWTKSDLAEGYPQLNQFLLAKRKYDPEEKLDSQFWRRIK